jgi:hypothetical protein
VEKEHAAQAPTTTPLLVAALMLTGFVDYAKADFNHPTPIPARSLYQPITS